MQAPLDWLVRIFTDGLTAEERRKFLASLWRVFLFVHVIWAWGLMGSESGFAKARDIPDDLENRIETIIEQLERSNENQRKLLLEAVAGRIRDLHKICIATEADSPERRRLVSDIENAQREYQELTKIGRYRGDRYPLNPQCN